MTKLLERHVNNPGRHNMSVAESSYDTWLDGYRMGVRGRKGSIYVEGAVLAFLCDTRIMERPRARCLILEHGHAPVVGTPRSASRRVNGRHVLGCIG